MMPDMSVTFRCRLPGIAMMPVVAAALALCLAAGSAAANEQSFDAWRDALRQEALSSGISAATFDTAFAAVQPIPRIIELDRSQPEFTMTFPQYLERVVPQSRIDMAREKLRENWAVLEAVGKKYGVQPRFIVALWGIESDFGRRTGDFSVVASLATLAYDGRRSEFFRKELLDALHILDRKSTRLNSSH